MSVNTRSRGQEHLSSLLVELKGGEITSEHRCYLVKPHILHPEQFHTQLYAMKKLLCPCSKIYVQDCISQNGDSCGIQQRRENETNYSYITQQTNLKTAIKVKDAKLNMHHIFIIYVQTGKTEYIVQEYALDITRKRKEIIIMDLWFHLGLRCRRASTKVWFKQCWMVGKRVNLRGNKKFIQPLWPYIKRKPILW